MSADITSLNISKTLNPAIPAGSSFLNLDLFTSSAFAKVIVALVSSSSSAYATSFYVYNAADLTQVCVGNFSQALKGFTPDELGFIADNTLFFMDPMVAYIQRDAFYSMDLITCKISSQSQTMTPLSYHFRQAIFDPNFNQTRVYVVVDQGNWPQTVPWIGEASAVQGEGLAIQSKIGVLSNSTIGIAHVALETGSFFASVDQTGDLLLYDMDLNQSMNVTLSLPPQQIPVALPRNNTLGLVVITAARDNEPGHVLQYDSSFTLVDDLEFTARGVYTAVNYVFVLSVALLTRYTL